MRRDFGRFTVRGGAEVEDLITEIIDSVIDALSHTLRDDEYRSIVLIGGYGRGEGGVEEVGGQERPHNNFDFLVIHTGGSGEEIKRRVDQALSPLVQRFDIGLDVGVISERKLKRSPCLVMWYDMRFGHKTLLGDANFVRGLSQFRVDRILPADIRNLLVNRGTLILINDLLLARPQLSETDRKTIVKHAIKTIIGYGDALLFFMNRYDYSYVEKQRRMREQHSVPPGFRALYDEAMEFRFRPNYPEFLGRDLGAWNDELRHRLSPIHLDIENRRLGWTGAWKDYANVAFRHALLERPLDPRAAIKKVLHLWRGPALEKELRPLAKLGYRAGGMREMLSIVFPVVAYRLEDHAFRQLGCRALHARSTSDVDLRSAYLRAFGIHGDTNFPAMLRKHGLQLDGSR